MQSMQFGLILLGIIIVLSAAGSVIPQNEPVMTYVRNYPSMYQVILALQLNNVFSSWYFIAVSVLLCINLFFCSIIRISRLSKLDPLYPAMQKKETDVKLTAEGVQKVRNVLEGMHCQKRENIYYKNLAGRYGSFITHLGILLTVIFWGMAMYMPKITDSTCMPQEYILLDDGTRIGVDSFSIEDENGKLDYSSVVKVVTAEGSESEWTKISVNHPASFKGYKVYQQTYGTKGRISVSDKEGHKDSFYVDANDFLSADGKTGMLFDNLYPDIHEENGRVTMVTNTSGSYPNPVYVYTTVIDNQQQEVMLAFPGDTAEIGDYTFYFEEPVEYPGLRIKKVPVMINYLLLTAFVIMTLGLYITFFWQPVIVKVDEDGYSVIGNRQEGIRLTLKQETKGDVIGI